MYQGNIEYNKIVRYLQPKIQNFFFFVLRDVNALYGISNLRNKLFKNFLASKKTKIESKSETSSTGSLLSRSANYSLRKQQVIIRF